MNININVNDRSGVMDSSTENSVQNTSSVSDAGPSRASSELSVADDYNFDDVTDITSSEAEDFDIGGPPEWLAQAITSSLVDEGSLTDDTITDDIDAIDDGGSGPME